MLASVRYGSTAAAGDVVLTERQLEKRVKFWVKRLHHLGLGHWRLDEVCIVGEIPEEPGAVASVQTSHLYDNFRMLFRSDYIAQADGPGIDETIVHELIHVVMRNLDRTYETVEEWMPKHTYDDFMVNVVMEREAFVERMARALYSLVAEGDNGWAQRFPR